MEINMSTTSSLGLELMLYGPAGVFTTLILFILMLLGLTKIFTQKEDENQAS